MIRLILVQKSFEVIKKLSNAQEIIYVHFRLLTCLSLLFICQISLCQIDRRNLIIIDKVAPKNNQHS